MSRLKLTIPATDLYRLPPGSSYTERSGQATATVSILNDTLFVTATCDSLQRLVWRYESEQSTVSHSTVNYEKETTPAPSPLRWFIYGVIAGLIITIALLLAWRRSK